MTKETGRGVETGRVMKREKTEKGFMNSAYRVAEKELVKRSAAEIHLLIKEMPYILKKDLIIALAKQKYFYRNSPKKQKYLYDRAEFIYESLHYDPSIGEEDDIFKDAYKKDEISNLRYSKRIEELSKSENPLSDTDERLDRKAIFDLKTKALEKLIGEKKDKEKLQGRLDELKKNSPYNQKNYEDGEYQTAKDRVWDKRRELVFDSERALLHTTIVNVPNGLGFSYFTELFNDEWEEAKEDKWKSFLNIINNNFEWFYY